MKPKQIALLSAFAAISAATLVAETVSFNDTFSFVPTGNDTVTLQQFDPSLGTLNSVTVTVVLNKTGGRGQADNDSANSGTVSFTQTINASLSSSDVALVKDDFSGNVGASLNASSSSGPLAIGATTGDDTNSFNNTGLADYIEWDATNASDNDSGSIASSAWGSLNTGYIGLETFSIVVSGTQSTSIDGLGGVQTAQVVSSASGTVSVEYNYSPTVVPEAKTSSLLAGLLAFGWVMARRRRS